MTEQTGKQLQVKEKQEAAIPAEQTRPGAVFSPNVDIYETDQAITLLADLPGVKTEGLTIDLRDSVLTLSGDVQPLESGAEQEEQLIVEYGVGRFFRQFTLSDVIDQEHIDAKLKDGVLTLTLPKVEKATPRMITITAG